MGIVEGSKPKPTTGKKTYKKTILFGILSAASLVVLILTLVVWGVATYSLQTIAL